MKKYLVYIILVLLIIISGSLLYFWLSANPGYRFGTDRASVITQMQSLAKLETASFNIDKVIEASTDYGQLRQFLFGDKILLVAHGQVVAGFDLSKMKPQDYKGYGSSVSITLPAPEIFSTTIDNSQTKVFSRSTGLFTKGELNLEAEARTQAETAIRKAACDGGILDEATKNVKKQIELLFKSSGFTNITITTAIGSCKS